MCIFERFLGHQVPGPNYMTLLFDSIPIKVEISEYLCL